MQHDKHYIDTDVEGIFLFVGHGLADEAGISQNAGESLILRLLDPVGISTECASYFAILRH